MSGTSIDLRVLFCDSRVLHLLTSSALTSMWIANFHKNLNLIVEAVLLFVVRMHVHSHTFVALGNLTVTM